MNLNEEFKIFPTADMDANSSLSAWNSAILFGFFVGVSVTVFKFILKYFQKEIIVEETPKGKIFY